MWNKKYIYTGLVILLLLGTVFVLSIWQNKHALQSYEFKGMFSKYDGVGVVVKGTYALAPDSRADKQLRTATVMFDDTTKITKVLVTLPTKNGQFNGSDVKRQSTAVDVTTFKSDLSGAPSMNIFAKATVNIYNHDSFKASEITYEVLAQQ